MNTHLNHSIKVLIVIMALAISSLIFGISAADYYSYPRADAAIRRINRADEGASSEDYKAKVRNLFLNISSAASVADRQPAALSDIKAELLSIIVPKEFMNLHIGLVLVVDKLIDYSNSKNKLTLEQANSIISEAKNRYDWLN